MTNSPPLPGRRAEYSMLSYTLKRLLQAVPTMLVVITLSFFLMRVAPGGPFDGERQLPPEIERLCLEYAMQAHRRLGCRGVSRSDYRWDDERGEAGLFLLETNTQPGMTPLSLVPEQARYCGIEYPQLCEMIVEDALRRAGRLADG